MNYEIDLDSINEYNTHKFKLNGENSALLVIDMQNYFKSNMAIISANQIYNINSLILFAKKNHIPVIYTRHNDDEKKSKNLIKWWGDILEKDTHEWQIINELDISESIIINKNQYSSFYETKLINILQEQLVKNIIICGVMTNFCCETTAKDAFMFGYNVIFVSDATATINPELHLATIRNIAFGFGQVINTNDINTIL